MAKGDTKTNQYLDIAANGTRADLPSDTCCETRTQTLIRGVAERIMDVEDEVEELKNNPDVVDIVDTYADLQNYPTSGLTDKDVIRVIADETKGGLSSYYRWNSPNPGWNFVGVIPGGDGIKELSSADYNYPTANPDRVALWLLDNGLYTAPAGVMVAASTTSYPWYNTSGKTILVGGSDTVKGIYTFLNGKVDVVTTQVSDGTEADEYTLLKSTQVLQATGQSTTDVMSQKAVTDALASAGGGGVTELTSADYNYPTDNPTSVALWLLDTGFYKAGANIPVRYNTSDGVQSVGLGESFILLKSTDVTRILIIKQANNDTAPSFYLTNYNNGVGVVSNQVLGGPTVVQATGTSTTDVMSQNATTSMVFADPADKLKVRIGQGATASGGSADAVGYNASATGNKTVALGTAAVASADGAVALGANSSATQQGEVAIGTSQTNMGYNSSNYRLLTGLYDPQSAHDAATKGYVDSAVNTIDTALDAKQDELTPGTGISITEESGALVISATGAQIATINAQDWSALWQ